MRNLTFKALTAGVLLALAGTAGADSKVTSFQVTANVQGNCIIGASTLAFGIFNGQAVKDAESTITVRCTDDLPYAIALDGGTEGDTAARRMSGAGGQLDYQLFSDAARTANWGDTAADDLNGTGEGLAVANAIDHTVYGRIPITVLNESAKVGNDYADTIQVTITF
jgi:spore coat protein U-like protein